MHCLFFVRDPQQLKNTIRVKFYAQRQVGFGILQLEVPITLSFRARNKVQDIFQIIQIHQLGNLNESSKGNASTIQCHIGVQLVAN
jgi:hypothetical protein